MLNELQTFTALFSQLKSRVNDSATTLGWLSDQQSDLRRLAYAVGSSAERIRKTKASASMKHTVVPTGFITAWKEYENRFDATVRQIVEAENNVGAEEFLAKLREIAEDNNESFDSMLNKFVENIESQRQPGDSFDPQTDDPSSLIGYMVMTYEDVVGAGVLSDDESADKAIGAWRFFESTLGLSHRDIYNRWKSVPELLIPSHALQVNPRPIFDLYNEAVRTYIFGNKIAAIAMCRALLEHVLRKHYGINAEDLEKIIVKAEAEYNHLSKLDMQNQRRTANLIMHSYEKQSDVDDEIVVSFLKTIETIVKNIPR